VLREARGDAVIRIADEVAHTLRAGGGVVALETTLVAHGFPPGEGLEVGLASERAVREGGSVPATIGVLDGEIVVGLTEPELGRYDEHARKAGPRDLAAAAVQRAVAATTVGGTLAVCRRAGIRFMATGGLGGVHRGWPRPPDVSADLDTLARTPALVVSSGVKSLLDVPATAELLETLGVPVLGWRTDDLPLFYAAHGGPPVSTRVEGAREAADVAAAHWELGGGGLLLGRPPDESLDDVEPLIEEALVAAESAGIRGGEVTPFVLAQLHARSGGRTQRANRELIEGNARLAGEIAAAGQPEPAPGAARLYSPAGPTQRPSS
jgi:pseudouridine-5'-phosphate glycosidase